MCGICGILNIENDRIINQDLLLSMRDSMVHRGPDDAGIYISPEKNFGLGHRRLSIVDLSINGRQPMTNEDESIFLVFNGEIFNFLELRDELSKRGHIFKSNTDCEVIIHLYEEHGKECVHYLRGMFAFVIWDNNRKLLFLVRDPLGKKPLVYSHSNGRFYFASEIKALLSSSDVNQDIDHEAVLQYFAYNYIPYPHTIFKSIKKIPPASFIIVQNGKITIERYKFLNYGSKIKMDQNTYCKTFLDLLDESVKIRLNSDVPLGAMLSGGVDSSSIVAMMTKYKQHNIRTYSLGYQTADKKDADFNYAKLVAKKFDTCHKEIIVTPAIIALLPEIVQCIDEPNSQMAFPSYFFFLKEVKKDVKVVLSGDGGDEVFGGYPGYVTLKRIDLFLNISRIFPWNLLKTLCDRVIGTNPRTSIGRTICEALELLSLPKRELRTKIVERATKSLFSNLFNSDFLQPLKDCNMGKIYSDMYDESQSKNLVDAGLYSALLFIDQHGVIVLPDACGMANSIEIRAPYLDDKIVDFAASLPVNQKVKSLFTSKYNKYIIKKSFSRILPERILYREKIGFGESIPINDWCKTEWKEYISNMIFTGSISKSGIFNVDYIKKIWDEHISGEKDHIQLIWSLLIFEVWYQLFIEKTDPDIIRYHY